MAWVKIPKIIRKREFIEMLIKKTGYDRSLADKILHSFLDSVGDALAKDGILKLKGFGTFEVYERGERRAYNVQTREYISVPSLKSLRFKAGTYLKDYLN